MQKLAQHCLKSISRKYSHINNSQFNNIYTKFPTYNYFSNQKLLFQFSSLTSKQEDKLQKLQKNYASMVQNNKQYEAMNTLKDIIKLKEKGNLDTLQDHLDLGQIFVNQRNLKQAKQLYKDLLKKYPSDLQEEELIVQKAQIISDNATVFYIEKEYSQAQNLYKQAIMEYAKVAQDQQNLKKSSKYNREVAITLLNVGECLKRTEQYYESSQEYQSSILLFQELLNQYETQLKNNSQDNIEETELLNKLIKDTYQKLSYAYEQSAHLKGLQQQNQLEDLKNALEYGTKSHGESSPYLLPIINNLADVFSKTNNKNAALKLYSYALDIIEKNGQEVQFNDIYAILISQARLQSDMNMHEDAFNSFIRIEKLLNFVEGNMDQTKLMIKGHKGYLSIQQKKFERAQEDIEQGLQLLQQQISDQQLNLNDLNIVEFSKKIQFLHDPQMTGILGILLCQYGYINLEVLEKYEMAYELGKEAINIVQGSNKGDCLNVMGQSKLQLGEKQEAVKLLRESSEIFLKERPQEALQIKNQLEKLKQQN